MDRGVDGAGAAHVCRRVASAARRHASACRSKNAGTASRRRLAKPLDARRGRDAREGHVDRKDGSEPLRAGADPVDRSGTRSRNPPRVQRASQLETTRRCASRIIASRTGDENQSTRRRGGRGSPRTPLTRLGSGGAILRAAHDARGAGQPPQPGQPEQSARPEGEGRDQVR